MSATDGGDPEDGSAAAGDLVSSGRRITVCLSRPKEMLLVVGNPRVLECAPPWRRFLDECVRHGAVSGVFADEVVVFREPLEVHLHKRRPHLQPCWL